MKYRWIYIIYIIPLLKNKMKIQNFVSETIIVQKSCAIYTNVKHHFVVSETIIVQNMRNLHTRKTLLRCKRNNHLTKHATGKSML